MKLLISAYAATPNRGSEHAVGWNWITEAHRLGHQVWALSSPAHRRAILEASGWEEDLAGITWLFPEVPGWRLGEGKDAKWERSHNLLWQVAALNLARRLAQTIRFDAVHHLTWCGIRAPTFLGALGVPLVIGPIGGGETSPPALRRDLRLKARLTEAIRDFSNASIVANPILRIGLSQASMIAVKTPETRALLPQRMQGKADDFQELTISPALLHRARERGLEQPRLLSVGRLLYWKGTHLTLLAFARLYERRPGARLTVVGRGPEGGRLRALARALGIAPAVEFIDSLPQARVFETYDNHDLLVFPSLHDSGGTVVLEALARGLPAMCLDLGGPRQTVTPQAGIVIPTKGRDAEAVSAAMAEAMHALFDDPAKWHALSAGAVRRARNFLARDQVRRFYDRVAICAGPATFAAPVQDLAPTQATFGEIAA